MKASEAVIVKFSRKVWDKAAIGLSESDLMEVQIQELEVAGFKIVNRNSGGRPTAFVVEWSQGSGGPNIGFLPEYDALAAFGLAALAHCKLFQDGKPIAHAHWPNEGHWARIAGFPKATAEGDGHGGKVGQLAAGFRVESDRPCGCTRVGPARYGSRYQ